jgi:hypothetical protein
MIGYHITSIEHWEGIRRSGKLIPYRVYEHETKLVGLGFEAPVMAIWLWMNRLDEMSEMANVMWHVTRKKTKCVVVLEVTYDHETDAIRNGNWLSLNHHIAYADDALFYESSKGILLWKEIPLSRIRLVREYNLEKYVVLTSRGEKKR